MSGLDNSQPLTDEASFKAEEIHHESHAKEHLTEAASKEVPTPDEPPTPPASAT